MCLYVRIHITPLNLLTLDKILEMALSYANTQIKCLEAEASRTLELSKIPLKTIEIEEKQTRRGQYIAFVIMVLAFCAFFVCLTFDYPKIGLAALTAGLAPALIASILSRKNKESGNDE
jgi:hypothetical protein